MFLATGLSERQQDPDDDEFIEVVTVTVSKAIELILGNKIVDTKTIAGILFFKYYKPDV
jgi:ADP-ribose pyrophosphatase